MKRWGRWLLKLLALATIALLAVELFRDALTFALYPANPVTGRVRGCYTLFELALGCKRPAEWVRPLQLAAAGALFALGLVFGVKWWRSR